MELDIAHLTAFAAVVEEGSFDAAARRLHLTPSAVSQRIKALESRMGQILVRRTKPAQATEAGHVLARLAGQISLLESEALTELTGGRESAGLARQIPIAVNADSLATWFLPALAALGEHYSRLTFDIRQEDQDHSAALLRDGSVMAAVTAEPQVVQGCRTERLGAMRYLAVASPALGVDPLPMITNTYQPHRSTSVHDHRKGADALGSIPMLVFNRKDALQDRFAEMVTGSRQELPVTYLPSSRGFVEAAQLGLGWGMVPEQMARPALDDGSLVELVPGRHLDVPLFWQRWRLDSPALAALTAAVQDAAAVALRSG
ncbi:LysR family transcriptional regulator ArgP [Actinobacteria bacterium YIM 96077]|uniref:HTH-type transcriptional regulator LysG n=1 Tax=Phytoactinopolyspora halophila TaxID=1981511 RepID=A0A329QD34_9ACTN|nr:LysR family transcriptional regulator ArgP [Phytoactinopolyspora halophila]AYY14025.1 LysR family transcriptional regulator ArgP [Actinobacteria bacterium YIM 96077]RAW10276.1 ArgP/LysG family DNA-binding transcriptional regulator [Phytoactinopolyspora halophila]